MANTCHGDLGIEEKGVFDDEEPKGLRAILVSNIPTESIGIGLGKALRHAVETAWSYHRSQLQAATTESENKTTSDEEKMMSMEKKRGEREGKGGNCPQFRAKWGKTIHRRVRHGTALLIFNRPEDAFTILNVLSPKTKANEGEGKVVEEEKIEILLSSAVTTTRSVSPSYPKMFYEGQQLEFSWAAGQLRDHFFAGFSFEIRRKMKLDSVAAFSVTDGSHASRMASLLLEGFAIMYRRHLQEETKNASRKMVRDELLRIFDATACIGGNCLGFLKVAETIAADTSSSPSCRRVNPNHDHPSIINIEKTEEGENKKVSDDSKDNDSKKSPMTSNSAPSSTTPISFDGVQLTAMELDAKRCEMLRHNISVFERFFHDSFATIGEKPQVHIHQGDSILFLQQLRTTTTAQKNQNDKNENKKAKGEKSSDPDVAGIQRRPPFDVLFCDPPWGGVEYKKQNKTTATDKEEEKEGEKKIQKDKSKEEGEGSPPLTTTKKKAAIMEEEEENEKYEDDICDEKEENSDDGGGENNRHPASSKMDKSDNDDKFREEEGEEAICSSRDNDDALQKFTLAFAEAASDIFLDDEKSYVAKTPPYHSARVYAFKLPRTKAGDEVAQLLIGRSVQDRCHGKDGSERPFPFVFHFGASCQLLVIAVNDAANWGIPCQRHSNSAKLNGDGACSNVCPNDDNNAVNDDGCITMSNAQLDQLVSDVHHWSIHQGHREHRSKFYDYELQHRRTHWIELKKWIPSSSSTHRKKKGGKN